MSDEKRIIDCHYCENACCENAGGWCKCYNDDGNFSHDVEDSREEAENCPFFEYCDIFPKT